MKGRLTGLPSSSVKAAQFLLPVASLLWGQQPPCNLPGSSELAGRARAELEAKRFGGAANLFQQALAACPSQYTLHLELAQALLGQRHFDGAIAAAQEFLRAEPHSVSGRLVLANAYFMAQRFPDCLKVTAAVLKAEPANAAALKLKANALYLSGNMAAAENTFLLLLEKHPRDEEAAYMLGRMYYQEGRIDHAIGQFQRVLRLNPNAYKAYDNLGLCYDAANQPDTAIRYFLTAIKLVEKDYPDYDWPYANLAELLLKQEDNEKAFHAASTSARRNPYSARNFYLGGKALFKLGRMEDSLKWVTRATELDPLYPEPLYLLGQLYTKLGDRARAAEAFAKFREAKARAPAERK